ncbi:hypothetical protein SAMN04244553_1725 [Nocardia amikacinitolerans]|uniref:Tetratricopeptide repeat-containing protein n=1 Tax=Nocardia amikacinitolerans TaxID=756689 RepID=A0A285L6X6_9NOCA|nr:hypothetical protein [Nocardia amikacinitolerans]SNY79807.1 hypothetical protein SAMN04244553_1725 [Nocardia amikacinitolerans]
MIGPDGAPPPSPGIAAPPPALLRFRFGGGALAAAVLLGLVINIVSSLFLERGVGVLLSVGLLVVALLAVLLLVGRWLRAERRRLRESPHTARELELLSDFDDARTPIGANPTAPAPPLTAVSDATHEEAAVLGALPVREYSAAAVLAVLTAILDAPARDPSDGAPPRTTAPLLLTELIEKRFVEVAGVPRSGVQQYWVVAVPGTSSAADDRARLRWSAAITTLVRHHADRAERWSIGLGTPRFAAAGRGWFEAEEPFLRRLVTECASLGARLPRTAVPSLIRIGDALDVWHARTGGHDRELAEKLSALPDLDALGAHGAQVLVRADPQAPPPRRSGDRGRYADLTARYEHAKALETLADPSATSAEDLEQARRRLERVWWLLPREDIPGEVCALINLGVVLLRQGLLDDAQDRLELAEALTRQGRDPDGRAHMHEILGHVWWARGEAVRALRCWRLSLTAYRALRDDHGIARCLQHLAAAVIADPHCADDVLGHDPALPPGHAVEQATGWLAEAKALYPGARVANHYRARALLACGVSPRQDIDRWPLPLEENVPSH